MTDINPTFSLYHRTLRKPSAALCAIVGNFSGSKKVQEIVRATQTTLELWKFNKSSNEFTRILVQNSYCNIRNIASIKVIETTKDLILLTSDSGMLSIIEYDLHHNKFIPIKNETYYKTGIRRLSPGDYISVDPKGRAVMLTALERNKIVYVFTRENDNYSNKLAIMSPIEANRNHLLTYHIVAMDTGYENPIFAAIETDYSNHVHKKKVRLLNYYEFDLGLNHVVLKTTETIPDTSTHIISMPGGFDGPSGILLCSEGMIQYKCPFKPTHNIPIPLRKLNNESTKSIIICSVVHKMKNAFFILVQNQFGDLFKVTLEYTTTQETKYDLPEGNIGPGMITCIKIRYFDTIPICNSLVILKSGYLYADSQQGDHYIYQFEKLGTSDNEKEWSSDDYPDEQSVYEEENDAISFELRKSENINLVTINNSLSPLMDLKLSNTDFISSLPEIYSITGTGSRSSMKVLQRTISVTEIVTQELPSKIIKAFTCKIHKSDKFDKFIVLSFFDGSIILSIGEEVEEAENSGFIDTVTTLNIFQIGDDSIVQIHATGLKQIFYSENDEPIKSIDWNPPPGIEVIHSACTNTQVVLALSNGNIVYFEVSQADKNDALVEYSLHKEFDTSITSVAIGDIPKGRIRSPFIVVTCKNSTIHILSTDPNNKLESKFNTKLYDVGSSTLITSFNDKISDYYNEDRNQINVSNKNLVNQNSVKNFVHVGLKNGVYLRYELTNEGKLIKPNMKFIVASPLQIIPIKITNKENQSMTIATINSLTTFLVVPQTFDDIKLIPLPIAEKFIENEEGEELEYSKSYGSVVSLHSADVPQGLILAHDDKLSIVSLPLFNIIDQKNDDLQTLILTQLQSMDNIESIPLRYTPRTICDSNDYKISYIGCSDVNIDSFFQTAENNSDTDEIITYGNIEDEFVKNFEDTQTFGYPTKENTTASCIHVFSIENLAIGQTIELLSNQTICRIAIATLEHNHKIGDYLLVSTISNFQPIKNVKTHGLCYVRVYHIKEDGSLEYLYKHEFPQPVLSMKAFQGRVVLGFGNEIGIYELGKLQMLRKSGLKLETNGVHNIIDIQISGFRLYVSDIRSSVQIIIYDVNNNILIPLVDDCVNRHVTRSLILDHDTVIIGDKFGTLTVLRNPVSNLEIESSQKANNKITGFNGNNWKDKIKFDTLMSFYVGDFITGLFSDKIGIGGDEVIVYSGINGTIGALEAMKSIKEVNFFRELEKLIRNVLQGLNIGEFEQHNSKIENNNLMIVDRDILKFRSYYVPKKSCIDGDLIDEFFKLDRSTKIKIAKLLERSVDQVEEKIIEIRNRIGY